MKNAAEVVTDQNNIMKFRHRVEVREVLHAFFDCADG